MNIHDILDLSPLLKNIGHKYGIFRMFELHTYYIITSLSKCGNWIYCEIGLFMYTYSLSAFMQMCKTNQIDVTCNELFDS